MNPQNESFGCETFDNTSNKSLESTLTHFTMSQQHLETVTAESSLSYWKQELAGAPDLISLPTDRPGPAVQSFQGEAHSFVLPSEIAKSLGLLSKQEKVTLYMTMLAAFKTLLYRYTSSEDIVVGSAIANRNHPDTEGLIGFFVNTLVLRTNFSENPSFQKLLHQVKEVALGAYTHQDLPFSMLVEALQPKRDLSYSPLFQVMFVFEEDTNNQEIQLPGLTASSLALESNTSKFDLTLFLEQSTEGIRGRWEYNTDLFDASTIERMSGHFQMLLEGIIANPEQLISDLPILTNDEQQQLLVEWNDTQISYQKDKCIHQLFEEQVERTPDAVAVVFEDKQLTYRELNNRANQLAHYLEKLGVKPEVLVGICIERSLEMIVGLLAILKAGGAYVPFSPTYPEERIAYMLQDSQVQILLTQEKLVAQLPKYVQIICLDKDWQTICTENEENFLSRVRSENLAYVIYTSGSTGKPKGVAIEHHSILNLLQGLKQTIYAREENSQLRVSVNGPLAFDTSVKQVIQLLHGHTIDIVPEEIRLDGDAMLSYLRNHQIDVLDCTPSQFGLLLTAGLLEGVDSVKYVLLGGESIDESTWQDLAKIKSINFYNVYGPTECTVDATISNIQIAHNKPIIGRPISNTQIYILDSHLQPVPVGVSGEVHIGGVGLARCYLNRPDLTKGKFISHPFSNDKQARLYKTGDKARYLVDGNIEYIGRVDDQVKIRGFRIELGEIEAILNQHPDVLQTVVIAREDVKGDKRLVAYIIPDRLQTLTIKDLQNFLSQKLPNYMIPSAFVILETLPLTPNSKIDRLALPAPDYSRQESEESFVPPRNQLELQLTKIWEKVLGVQPIGITNNFFELGGHSLLIVRLLSEIKNSLGKNLPLSAFFAAQTVEQLAAVLAEEKLISWSSLVPIQTNGTKLPLFLIHAVWGNVLFYRKLVHYLEPDQPVYGLQAQGLDGKQAPSTCVMEMAANYIKEIRTIQPQGPYSLGGFSFGGVVAFEIARQLCEQGQEIAFLGIFDTSAPELPKASTDTSAEKTAFLGKILFHTRKLFKLGLKEQFNYLWARIYWHFMIGKLSIFYRSYLRYIKRSLPELLLLNLNLANSQARQTYLPSVYPGKLTLLVCGQMNRELGNEDDLGWKKLALGGVEIHKLNGSHTTIMEEPDVKLVAEELHSCLEQLQSDLKQ